MSERQWTVARYIVYFDKPLKAAALREFIEGNPGTSFSEAATMLGYEHGVDFLYCMDGES